MAALNFSFSGTGKKGKENRQSTTNKIGKNKI
jgi:hypothetical protein